LNDFPANIFQTREEKKLEAIVKAFERMEKRELHQRKKERQEQTKKPKEKDKERDKYRAVKLELDSDRSDAVSSSSQKITKQHSAVCPPLFLHSTNEAVCIMLKCVGWLGFILASSRSG